MRTTNIFILILFFSVLGCGVKRDLGLLPTLPTEFRKPLNELEEKYPNLKVYKKRNFFSEVGPERPQLGYCTPVESFITRWGQPDEKKLLFWDPYYNLTILAITPITLGTYVATGVFMAIYPVPNRRYIWNKGNYAIEATVMKSSHCRYINNVLYLDWKMKEIVTDISESLE